MAAQTITPTLKFLPLRADIPGYERFFGTYLLHGDKYALVDVGPAAVLPSLLSELQKLGIKPREIDYVVLSHIHMDHSGGTGAAVKEMARALVIAHERARPHLADPTRLWEASLKTLGGLAEQYGRIEPVPEDRIINAADSTKLDLGRGLQPEILLTPGHAYHHLSLFDRASGVLIAGEAAGVCVDGALRPSTPPPFRLEEALSSIGRLIVLEPERVCFAHLGCYDNGAALLTRAKQQLEEWHEAVQSGTVEGKSPEEIFDGLMRDDRSLDYLRNLSINEYERERKMLINSVIGLASQKKGKAMVKQSKVQWVYSSRDNRELTERYDEWARDYDSDLKRDFECQGPERAAEVMAQYVPKEARICDAGAGTGLVGQILASMGYKNMVGFDMSKGMLEEARKKGVYRELHQMVMGEPLDFESDSFDAVISVGVLTLGHAPASSFDELIRITRPGGHIVFTLRPDVYENSGFKEKQSSLEFEERWKLVEVSDTVQLLPRGEPDVHHQIWVYRLNS